MLVPIQETFGAHVGLVIYKFLRWMEIGCATHAIQQQTRDREHTFRIAYRSTGYNIYWPCPGGWDIYFGIIAKDKDTVRKCALRRQELNYAMSQMKLCSKVTSHS